MLMDEKECLYCGDTFVPHRHNMLYCNPKCCKIATNQKVIKRYHQNKQRKNNKNRFCSDCTAILSKYNDNDKCYSCIKKIEEDNRKKLLMELNKYVEQI